MSKDWGYTPEDIYRNRDVMLAEIHKDVTYLRANLDDHKKELVDHKADDDKFQSSMDNKLGWAVKIGVVILVIVAANGGLSAIKVLFHV